MLSFNYYDKLRIPHIMRYSSTADTVFLVVSNASHLLVLFVIVAIDNISR